MLFVVVTCSQIVSVLRESNGGDRARVAGEVGHVGALLQIPDLDLRVSCSSTKDETIRVELSTGESCGGANRNITTWNRTLIQTVTHTNTHTSKH